MGVSADASYVLSGGMGALGLVTAQALAEEGAKSLLLMSRSGRPGAEVQNQWRWLQESALQVTAWACDVSSATKAELQKRLLAPSATDGPRKKCPVRGILHLAGVLDDAMLPQLTRQHLERAYAAKVVGAKNLHAAANLDSLDFFLLYSSTAALLGAAGRDDR
ncbi:unnamed protein product [Durusdinium trenchii]|uniref:Ketoreductase domain-containing protein n=1 Tax=Durusdinium trenchii TaxID=1381693 RepID=A0ABP0MU65_9DINO